TGRVGRLLVPEHLGLARLAALVEVLGVGVAVAAAVPGGDRVVGGARLGVVGSPGDGLLVLLAVVVTADERPGGASGDEQRRHGGTDDHGRLPLERVAGTAAGRGPGRAGDRRLRVAVSGLPVGAGLLRLAVRTGLVRPGGVGAGLLSALLRVAVPGLRRTGRRALRGRRRPGRSEAAGLRILRRSEAALRRLVGRLSHRRVPPYSLIFSHALR